MSSAVSAHPEKHMAEHFATIRSYAKRVLMQGDLLSINEAHEKSVQMSQFLPMGAGYKCTDKEMVGLVYEGFLKQIAAVGFGFGRSCAGPFRQVKGQRKKAGGGYPPCFSTAWAAANLATGTR